MNYDCVPQKINALTSHGNFHNQVLVPATALEVMAYNAIILLANILLMIIVIYVIETLKFYQDWSNYQCKCISESATSEAISSETYTTNTTSNITPVTPFKSESSSQLSKSGKILAVVVVVLAVIQALVISGWVWTCWTVEKLKKQIKSSQTHK